MIIVTGSATARPGCFDALLEGALAHVRRSRAEPGCISHAVHVDCDNPLRLFFFEQWADQEALERHFRVPDSGAFIAQLRTLVTAAEGPALYEASVREK